MKLKEFIIVAQWGAGFRYIITTTDNEKEAKKMLEWHTKRNKDLRDRIGKGAKPTIMCYQLADI